MSLRVRIALISAGAVAVAVAIAALLTYSATKSELIAEVDSSLYLRLEQFEEIEDLRDLGQAVRQESQSSGPFRRGRRGFDAIFWQYLLVGTSTAVTDFPGSGGLPIGPLEQAVYDGDSNLALRTVAVEGDDLRMLTSQVPTGVVQVARSLAEVNNSLVGLANVLRFAAVVGALLAGVVGYFVARGAARPIGQLAEAAEHVAETQELAARIDVHRSDEVGRLAESFNAMLAALEGSREQQRRLVHDAGHELRTPLTAIRTNVELLGRIDDIPQHERTQMIQDIDSEIQELTALVGELVDLAAQPPTGKTVAVEINLGDLVDRVADKYRRRTGRTISVVADESMVVGDEGQLDRAVGNLIENAAKWGPEGTPIDVTLVNGRVEVADQGPGIDDADRPFVFDRFYRATKDRSTPGSGLGLAIVSKAAEAHGGSAFVGDALEGAIVGFEIPVVVPAQNESASETSGD